MTPVRVTFPTMPVARSAPGRAPGRPPGRRRAWTIGLSALAHLAALLALVLLTRRPPPQQEMAPSYELRFEGGQNIPSTAPEPGDSGPITPERPEAPPAPVLLAPPAPVPLAPPMPEAAPSDAVPPDAAVPPASPADPPAPPAEPLPSPAPPAAAPPPDLARAPVRVQPPPAPAPETPLVPDLVMPAPEPLPDLPPALAPPPRPAPPRPVPRPRPAQPPGSFANPMDLSFNQAPRADRLPPPRAGAAPGSVASRAMDLSTGAPKPGPNRSEAFFDARALALGAEWTQGVTLHWLRHRYYPQQAAENGEDGTVDLELTVDRTGRVQSAVLKQRSGSVFIDMAAVGTFRNARLPPLPEEVEAPYRVTVTISYILIR